MNASERQKWFCQQCGKPHQCGYVDRGFENLCPVIQETMQGWQLGYKDAIDKACELLNNFYNEETHSYLVKEDINAFRKAMEKQK